MLSGVEITVESGQATHVAGPNGSGKTSLLRVLAGLAAPRAGTLRRHAACAFVPEKIRLAPALRCGEWLRAMRALRGLTATDWNAAADASGLDPAAVLSGEPDAQADMATAALGGRGARAGLEVMLVLAVVVGLTVVFLAYPLALVAVGITNEFDRGCEPATSSRARWATSPAPRSGARSGCCSPRRG